MVKKKTKKDTKGLKKRILELLKKNPRGLTLIEISKLTGFSTITAARYIAELKGEKKIDIRKVGSANLHYLRE